jgi:hypothetical protein
MKRWSIFTVTVLLIFGSATTALAPVDLLPGEAASALAVPRPVTSGEVDRTGYVKGFYVSAAALSSKDFIARMESLLETTELNGVVLDFKSDRGYLTFPTQVPLAQEIAADRATVIKDPAAFLSWFQQRRVYTIARIVVFKDNLLANAYPGWAVYDANTGGVWHDHEGMGWVDGMQSDTWNYTVQLAVEAAQMGFDEVQFDYVRFPTDGNVSGARFSRPNTYENRTNAIAGLLAQTKAALSPFGTKVGADVFGYTAWVDDDLGIGQDIETIAPYLDVIAPMVYPSTFNAGLPGENPRYQNAIAYPYEVVYKSTTRAVQRALAVNPNAVVRPWLQDFKDYAFDGRVYTAAELRRQMEGAREGGARGWLLWDPSVRYTRSALTTAQPAFRPDSSGKVPVLVYTEPFAAATDITLAERSARALRSDLDWLREQGFYPTTLSDLVGGLHAVPAGKRPVVLTFDGSTANQFRLVGEGSVDPNSTVGVLLDYNEEHPADWPLRGCFFVRTAIAEPEVGIFGTADLAELKLQMLLSWGLEVGAELATGQALSLLDEQGLQQGLGTAQQQLATWLRDYPVRLLSLPGDVSPQDGALVAQGSWAEIPYSYAAAVLPDGGLSPSPVSPAFDPYRIPRIPAGLGAGIEWRAQLMRPGIYVSGGE